MGALHRLWGFGFLKFCERWFSCINISFLITVFFPLWFTLRRFNMVTVSTDIWISRLIEMLNPALFRRLSFAVSAHCSLLWKVTNCFWCDTFISKVYISFSFWKNKELEAAWSSILSKSLTPMTSDSPFTPWLCLHISVRSVWFSFGIEEYVVRPWIVSPWEQWSLLLFSPL